MPDDNQGEIKKKIKFCSNNIIYDIHSELKVRIREIPKEYIGFYLKERDPVLIEYQDSRHKLFFEYDKKNDLIIVIEILTESLKIITTYKQNKKRRLKWNI